MAEKSKKENAEQENQPAQEEQMPSEEQTQQEKADAPQKNNEWQDKYVRLCADFDNYKKRTAREALASYQNGLLAAVEELLPVIDNFDRATASIGADDSQLAQGIKMVAKQLNDCLDKLGVKAIPAVGENFDPNLHNAVMHIEDENYGENVVVEELLKGYKCGEKVVRHSMVKVAN